MVLLMLAVAYERGGKIELADKQFADATKTSNFDSGVALAMLGSCSAAAAARAPRMC